MVRIIHILLLILEKNVFSFLLLSMMLAIGLLYVGFVMLRYVLSRLYYVEVCPFYIYFVESYHKWILNFFRSFSWIYWDEHKVFIFSFVNMVYNIDLWCTTFSHPLVLEINPTWLWYMILLMYCQIYFTNILFRIFTSMFINDISL